MFSVILSHRVSRNVCECYAVIPKSACSLICRYLSYHGTKYKRDSAYNPGRRLLIQSWQEKRGGMGKEGEVSVCLRLPCAPCTPYIPENSATKLGVEGFFSSVISPSFVFFFVYLYLYFFLNPVRFDLLSFLVFYFYLRAARSSAPSTNLPHHSVLSRKPNLQTRGSTSTIRYHGKAFKSFRNSNCLHSVRELVCRPWDPSDRRPPWRTTVWALSRSRAFNNVRLPTGPARKWPFSEKRPILSVILQ